MLQYITYYKKNAQKKMKVLSGIFGLFFGGELV